MSSSHSPPMFDPEELDPGMIILARVTLKEFAIASGSTTVVKTGKPPKKLRPCLITNVEPEFIFVAPLTGAVYNPEGSNILTMRDNSHLLKWLPVTFRMSAGSAGPIPTPTNHTTDAPICIDVCSPIEDLPISIKPSYLWRDNCGQAIKKINLTSENKVLSPALLVENERFEQMRSAFEEWGFPRATE